MTDNKSSSVKNKLSDIWFDTMTDVLICNIVFLGLFVSAWEWITSPFVKKKPVTEDAKPVKFHCHQCGEEYTADNENIRFDFRTLMVFKPRECPNCGSIKTMPVMFEQEDLFMDDYRRLWKH